MMWCFVISFLFCNILPVVVYSSVQDGLVTSPWGKIRGVVKTSSSGLSYTSFEGIPYAKPPLGDLRFVKPVPSTGSNDTFLMADTVKPSCLVNNNSSAFSESEDCLYLDLYVPHINNFKSSSPLNVMVYIHGGGFVYYSGNLDPEFLLKKNVIVAFVHYRLGALGFLSTGDDTLKGNYGLWDQWLAMKWVKDNVAAFGGDPDTITLFGESAGSASVSFQILGPNSKGLFKRAILQSGTATSSWALSRQPAKFAKELGVRLGCPTGSSNTDLATCLRKIDGVHLQQEMFAQWLSTPPFQHIGDFMYVPVVDREFIPQEPLRLIRNTSYLEQIGAFEKDIIVGVLNDEGTLVTTAKYDSNIPEAPNFGKYFSKDIIPYMLYQRYGYSTPLAEGTVDRFYRRDIPDALLDKYMVSNAFADVQFVIPALEFLDAMTKTDTALGNRYLYYFDYCPSISPVICMGHGYDSVFVFNFHYNINFTSTDQRVGDTFTSLLTSFSKTGIPTALDTPIWTQYSSAIHSYLSISSQPKVMVDLFPKRLHLWLNAIAAMIKSKLPSIPAPIIG